LPDAFQPDQLLWELELGSHHYSVPRYDRGRLYLGVNDLQLEHPAVQSTGGGIAMCIDAANGKTIWQLPIPRYMQGTKAPYHFNHWKCGVCSRPAIDGDRLYIVGPRGDILCLDRNGQADGNEGPFLGEAAYMGLAEAAEYRLSETDGDIVWRYDLIDELHVVPHDVCGSSPLVYGDYLYACTSNGVDDTHRQVANPSAPSLVVLDKKTGRLAATDGNLIGEKTLHGQWSSPVVMTHEGTSRILFGGGDGVLYAFEPLDSSMSDGRPRTLRLVWKYDCCPEDYRMRDGRPIPYARWNRKSPEGPSEIIATPLVVGNRVYVGIGQSYLHGAGMGALSCINGLDGQKIWENRDVDRTLTDAASHGGLLYTADYSGQLLSIDEDTGETVWQHDLGAGVWCASPVIADDKIYISTERQQLWILKAGRQKEVIACSRLRSMAITPVLQDDTLYLPTQRRLFAIRID
jgi:outer membrane protein assembly factor BamB